MQLIASERDTTVFIADIVMRAVLDARNMYWLNEEDASLVWIDATNDVLTDIVPFWPARIDRLHDVVQSVDACGP
ncbi:MAG: hypothetical protein EOO40_06610, partial [Deltaproteobacteria bacterium]